MSNAAATATAGHYTITVNDEVAVEFNHKNTFAYVVIGRVATDDDSLSAGWRTWTVWAKTNSPRGAEQKWTAWGRNQLNGRDVDVLVVSIDHR